MDDMDMMGDMGWWAVVGAIVWLLLLGLLIVGIVWFVRSVRSAAESGARDGRDSDDAEEILRRRYAKGEIDYQEYFARLNDLADAGPKREP